MDSGGFFVVEKDVEMFLEACELKGLSMKTIGSYEQTLRLFMQHLYKNGIERTENDELYYGRI